MISALKFFLLIAKSASRIFDALLDALFTRRLLLLRFSIKCIKCIKFLYNIYIPSYTVLLSQELMHFLHAKSQHNGKTEKGDALLMHCPVHCILVSRYRLVHQVHHFPETKPPFLEAGPKFRRSG